MKFKVKIRTNKNGKIKVSMKYEYNKDGYTQQTFICEDLQGVHDLLNDDEETLLEDYESWLLKTSSATLSLD